MPMHDWSQIPSGLFHDFHQTWSIQIKIALNAGILPKGISALVEQRSGPWESDVLALERHGMPLHSGVGRDGGLVTMEPPVTRFVSQTNKEFYAARANRIVVKHRLGRTIAVIEILSPGNKDGRAAMRDFVEKTIDFLRAGVHVLMIDLFPPTTRDPFGMHKVIWDEIDEKDFVLPEGKDRILASYETGGVRAYYVEAIGVGDILPNMPLFLANGCHVPVPLESTYKATWDACPEVLREAVETGVMPEPDAE
jgi:Protein of unknown function (DUF4058)